MSHPEAAVVEAVPETPAWKERDAAVRRGEEGAAFVAVSRMRGGRGRAAVSRQRRVPETGTAGLRSCSVGFPQKAGKQYLVLSTSAGVLL